jgi:hypothetical protein
VDEGLWAGWMAPEGLLLAWTALNGAAVQKGARVAEVWIEGKRHEIAAPADGRLVHEAEADCVLQPGDVIGRVQPDN